MKEIDIKKLSKRYTVRKLNLDDVQMIYAFCKRNTQYYEYCGKEPSIELIEKDIEITPPGIPIEQKYYIGFFDNDKLVAVMDLVDGYPTCDYVYIGFFMMSRAEQGKGTGTEIVNESFHFIRNQGYRFVRLAYAKGNPQSEAFWKKNGFAKTGAEVDKGDYIAVVMQRSLAE